VKVRTVGERAVLVELPDNETARLFAVEVRRMLGPVVEEVVPGHETVLVVGRAERPCLRKLEAWSPPAEGVDPTEARTVTIAVRYDGVDLAEVATECGLSIEAVVGRHQAPTYTVAFLGFAPGFAYLVGGDPVLRPARLATPRVRVPAGAVAVAGEYSGIYPRESPGGWRLLGSTASVLFDPEREPPSLLGLGDRVQFAAGDA
jgi:KipI family sensor histidine kinase inhibitor